MAVRPDLPPKFLAEGQLLFGGSVMEKLTHLDDIVKLIERGALFVINDSGGKDSQVMKIELQKIIPTNQMLIAHAHLPEVEHPGTEEHAQKYSQGLTFKVVTARRTLLNMIRERGKFPSPVCKQCTSDLKRGPIEKVVRRHIKDNNLNGIVVNCMGMRAQESPPRAKLKPFKFNKRNSKAGREWYDWLPIHDLELPQVWDTIKNAGQEPHPVYAKGMSRLSCCFCIMGSKSDLTLSAKLYPELYKTYVRLEKDLNFTMKTSESLEEITGIILEESVLPRKLTEDELNEPAESFQPETEG